MKNKKYTNKLIITTIPEKIKKLEIKMEHLLIKIIFLFL